MEMPTELHTCCEKEIDILFVSGREFKGAILNQVLNDSISVTYQNSKYVIIIENIENIKLP